MRWVGVGVERKLRKLRREEIKRDFRMIKNSFTLF